MSRLLDLTGKRFGRLTAHWPAGRSGKSPQVYWLCLCDCGKLTATSGVNLRHHHSQSCGCWKTEVLLSCNVKHGQSRGKERKTIEYRTWQWMLSRCRNPKVKSYKYYGGRGIKVCKRWLTFENFFADMGPKPVGMSIERVDNDGHYEPANCKWATREEQSRNTRLSKLNASKVQEITRRFRTGADQRTLAKLFGVAQTNISAVVRRETWRDVR